MAEKTGRKTIGGEDKGIVYVSPERFGEDGKRKGAGLVNYENAAIIQMKQNKGKVTLKARGRAAGRAIDVASMLQRKGFAKIDEVKIGSFEVTGEGEGDDKKSNFFISTIEIPLTEIRT